MIQRIGARLGNYRLTRLVGEGGVAEVYLGKHIESGARVAIKIWRVRLSSVEAERFHAEASLLVALRHPHIVRVYDFGLVDATPYLIMDYIPNGSLRTAIRPRSRLPLKTVFHYVRQLADALHFGHEQKLVHGDLRPENILQDEQGNLVLTEFRLDVLARPLDFQSASEGTGLIAYAAPEQLQGRPQPLSDQYSLGIIIYEWLTGECPFQGTAAQIFQQHMWTVPPSFSARHLDLSPAIEQVVMVALQKAPHQRFRRIKGFSVAFERACLQSGSQPLSGSLASSSNSLSGSISAPRFPVPLTPLPTVVAPRRRLSMPVILIIASGGLACILLGAFLFISLSFHQEITTGNHIVSIRLGDNYQNGIISGNDMTFHSGDTVFLICKEAASVGNGITEIHDQLFIDATTLVGTSSGVFDTGSPIYYNFVIVQATGTYTWSVSYKGVREASITFNVS